MSSKASKVVAGIDIWRVPTVHELAFARARAVHRVSVAAILIRSAYFNIFLACRLGYLTRIWLRLRWTPHNSCGGCIFLKIRHRYCSRNCYKKQKARAIFLFFSSSSWEKGCTHYSFILLSMPFLLLCEFLWCDVVIWQQKYSALSSQHHHDT